MASGRQIVWGAVGVIFVSLLASSVVFGAGNPAVDGRNPVEFGDGDASVSVEQLSSERIVVDRGRFGTGVFYLRVPDARVSLTDVTDSPRLIYRIEVPGLDVDESTTRVLRSGETGTVTLPGTDVAFGPGQVEQDSYTARISVRIQSFEVDRTVASTNETVEVQR